MLHAADPFGGATLADDRDLAVVFVLGLWLATNPCSEQRVLTELLDPLTPKLKVVPSVCAR